MLAFHLAEFHQGAVGKKIAQPCFGGAVRWIECFSRMDRACCNHDLDLFAAIALERFASFGICFGIDHLGIEKDARSADDSTDDSCYE